MTHIQFYEEKIATLEETIDVLDQGVENKKQLEKVKEVFKEREEELVGDIKTLQVEVENKDKIINVLKRNGKMKFPGQFAMVAVLSVSHFHPLNSMSASDTSIFNQKNGTDEKPKEWFFKRSILKYVLIDKPTSKICKKSKHKKHPTIAKIDSHVDENGQLVVDCPDLWVRKLK